MAVPLASPYSYFTDDNGNPLAGGLVYTYAAGTDTPKATYTDYAEGTPAANPVVLDAYGRATIWIVGAYKIVVKTSAGVTVKTTDHVEAPSTGGDMDADVYDPANIDEQLVGLTATQTLSNKTLTTPNIGVATATSISFGGTALANYVEGSFTPGIAFGGASVDVAYGARSGSYTRIGNRVYFSLNVAITNNGSSTGALTITGLPVAAAAADCSHAIGLYANFTGLTGTPIAVQSAGASVIQIYQTHAATATAVSNAAVTDTAVIYISGSYPV